MIFSTRLLSCTKEERFTLDPAMTPKTISSRWVSTAPPRQTTSDFLTSVTNPQERKAREGMENKVPRTPEEIEAYWKNSPYFAALQQEISDHAEGFPLEESQQSFDQVKRYRQAKHVRSKSPYVISIPMQVKLCTVRAYQRYTPTVQCDHP